MWRWFDEEDLRLLKEVLDSGHLNAIGGQQTPAFEREFAQAVGAEHAVAVCNAMAGLHAAVAASGAGAGDEVVVDSIVGFGALAAIYNCATPVFADIDPATHNMSPASLRQRITERTKAVIVTHLWGLCADMDEIVSIAREHNLLVIEDCAHALFATYNGRYAGTIGDYGVFSFQQSKHMTTGDGGMVVCASEELADRIREFINFGTIPERLAWNYRMNELTAAVGRVQLTRAREYVRACQRNAGLYNDAVVGCEWLAPQAVPPGREHAYHIWAAAFYGERAGITLTAFRQACEAEGFWASFSYIGKPPYLHEVIRQPLAYGRGCPTRCPHLCAPADYREGLCPNAEDLMPRLIILGPCGDYDAHARNAEALRQAIERLA
ncbi:MAG: DegT/DnrJ/EryC1/StrS family aminotransferase [Armatimonadetes bacterium]|nr:DegT/DnrJ/EryC1/StrS family aminotransferase [Armatimonadota bacterium]